MSQVDSENTTDLSAIQPTSAEMEAMWLAARLQDAAEVREFERKRARFMAGIYGDVGEAA